VAAGDNTGRGKNFAAQPEQIHHDVNICGTKMNSPEFAGKAVDSNPDAEQAFARLLNPRAVAVVGASQDISRIGGQPLRLLADFGYKGAVYPINPKYQRIKGMTCYPDLASIPQPCDVALIALSAKHVPEAIRQCGAAQIPFAIILSSGFGEVGGEGVPLQEALMAAARESNVRIVGPNCLGILNLRDDVRIGFGGTSMMTTLIPGPFAMVTQSGGFGFGIVAIAAYYGVGFNYAVSTGNEADISSLDLVEALIERSDIEAVVLFIESVAQGRRLQALGRRALQLGKPILIWKIGNTEVGQRAALSHSARMTSGYELFQAVFRDGGFIEIQDIDGLIDVLKVIRIGKLPQGNRVCVISPSGGSGVLLADKCVENGLELPCLHPQTADTIREFVVSFASVANPIDATANGYNDKFASYSRLIETVLADPGFDQVIIRAPRGTAAMGWAQRLLEAARDSAKPILVNWPSAPDDNAEVMTYLEQNGVPCIVAPGRGAYALGMVTQFAAKRRAFIESEGRGATRVVARQVLELPAADVALNEVQAKVCLAAYGIPTVREILLDADAVATLTSPHCPFPVAVKVVSPDIAHKTEAGGVRLNVQTLDELKAAAREVVAAARTAYPAARIEGVVIQEMAQGVEVIVGAVNDAQFGPVVVFGLGGIFSELIQDVKRMLAPFDRDAARGMIAELRGSALFSGFRGRAALDVEALADALSRVSLLAADHAERIGEIDINPLIVRPVGQGVVAADALIVLRRRQGDKAGSKSG